VFHKLDADLSKLLIQAALEHSPARFIGNPLNGVPAIALTARASIIKDARLAIFEFRVSSFHKNSCISSLR